jgi:hypothetical protein
VRWRFERQAKRHTAATGNTNREYFGSVDADFSDELVRKRSQNFTSSILSLFAA